MGYLEFEHWRAKKNLKNAKLSVRRKLPAGEPNREDLLRVQAAEDEVVMTKPHSLRELGGLEPEQDSQPSGDSDK